MAGKDNTTTRSTSPTSRSKVRKETSPTSRSKSTRQTSPTTHPKDDNEPNSASQPMAGEDNTTTRSKIDKETSPTSRSKVREGTSFASKAKLREEHRSMDERLQEDRGRNDSRIGCQDRSESARDRTRAGFAKNDKKRPPQVVDWNLHPGNSGGFRGYPRLKEVIAPPPSALGVAAMEFRTASLGLETVLFSLGLSDEERSQHIHPKDIIRIIEEQLPETCDGHHIITIDCWAMRNAGNIQHA